MFTCLDAGSEAFVFATGIGEALRKTTGLTVRVLPTGTGVGRITAIKTGIADIALCAYEAYAACQGIEEFASPEWGPQKLVSLYTPVGFATGAATKASSLETLYDLKGAKVGYIVGLSSINKKTEAMLAFANLTWDDVEVVEFPSFTACIDGLIQGKIDWFGSSSPGTSKLYEVEASPMGLKFLELPKDDVEGWKRLHAVFPGMQPQVCPFLGAGVKEGDKMPEGYSFGNYLFMCLENRFSEEEAYAIIKAIDEAYEEEIKDNWPNSGMLEMEKCIGLPGEVPFHPGTIRYAKEKGLWTDEHEVANKAVIDSMAKVQQAWDTVIDETIEKEIKPKDFSAYWLERRAELVK